MDYSLIPGFQLRKSAVFHFSRRGSDVVWSKGIQGDEKPIVNQLLIETIN